MVLKCGILILKRRLKSISWMSFVVWLLANYFQISVLVTSELWSSCILSIHKLHKGIGWEPNAEKDYEALKMLHEKEVEKHGEDTLSVKDAYMEVFKQKSGYVKGLGPGACTPKKCRIQKLKDDAAAREASLASEIETLKASNDELKTSNEELIASND
ncbi:hypothetical protein RDABS01_030716 [Bienertia sinuspersici]